MPKEEEGNPILLPIKVHGFDGDPALDYLGVNVEYLVVAALYGLMFGIWWNKKLMPPWFGI